MRLKVFPLVRGGLKYIFDANYRTLFNADRGKYDDISDEDYLRMIFKAKMGIPLNLSNPQTFNEKLQWLKLYDRKPEYTTMVDKYAAKQYVSDLIGEEYVIPSLGIWENFNAIEFDLLPEQFVLKTNHGCGGMVICRDKQDFDLKKARKIIMPTFSKNYYLTRREWPYKDVEPCVFAEKYMQNGSTKILPVYKVFNFNGVPKIIQAITNDKTKDETIDYFDTEWHLLNIRQNYPNSKVPPKRPRTIEKILELSSVCSQNIPFLRTDWYEINEKVFFSEFTFYSDAGMEPFHPYEWDKKMGDWIDLTFIN